MNCRDFIKEFEERRALSETATRHLNDCVGCRKSSAMQTGIWRVIDGFKPVDAPKDFDFRVKARIAATRPRDFQPHLFPVLRYALGLSVLALILAFVAYNGIYFLDDKTVPQVAESNRQLPKQKENLTNNSSTMAQAADNPPLLDNRQAIAENPKTHSLENKKESRTFEGTPELAALKTVKKPAIKSAKEGDKNSGGSQLNSVSPPARIFTPKGINPTQKIETSPNAGNVSSITAEQILSELGIETVSENGRRKVKKIKPNSVAERSSVRAGDWVEAIDGEKLTSEPIRSEKIEGKKLTITRGAEKLEILLHN